MGRRNIRAKPACKNFKTLLYRFVKTTTRIPVTMKTNITVI